MKNFRKALLVFALIAALFVGIVTTAMASEASDDTADGSALTLEEKKAEVEANTPLKQYDLPVVAGPFAWESGAPETIGTSWGQILGDVGCNDIGVEYEENGNGYFVERYHGEAERAYEAQNGGVHTYAYINVKDRNAANNLVMEFDITTFGDKLPYAMGIEHSTVLNDVGGRSQPRLLDIKPDGTFVPSYTGAACQSGYTLTAEEQANLAKCKIVKDEWMHISILYDSETCFATLYVNYEYICKFDTRPKGVTHYDLTIFRFGSANGSCVDGEVAFDNFIAYEGSYIRTTDLFYGMSEHEKFMYYIDYMRNENAQISDRVFAYNSVTRSLSDYWSDGSFIPVWDGDMSADELAELNTRLETKVGEYNTFVTESYPDLYHGYIVDNLASYKVHVEGLSALERTLDTVDDREEALDTVEKFLETVGVDILMTEDSGYAEVQQAYIDFVAKLDNDKLILQFNGLVDKIYNALNFSVNTIQKHYDNAASVKASIDPGVADDPGFEAYADALARFDAMYELIGEKVRSENSKRIVNCVGFISGYTTVEEWEANYDFINRYILIIRETVRENNFDDTYEGLEEALAFYNLCDEYFYGLLQNEHIAVIREMLDLYAATDGYVEKVGICAHLAEYFATEDIDFTRDEISAALVELYTYQSELEQYKTDYNEVLVQNTSLFANLIRRLSVSTDYAEMLDLYNQARTLYFAMNAGDESIAEELALYDEYTEYFAFTEQTSTAFLLSVSMLGNAATEDERYAALVDCYILLPHITEGYEGVSAALAEFNLACEAHDSYAETVNSELEAVTLTVGSLRANCGVSDVVAVIVKKFDF